MCKCLFSVVVADFFFLARSHRIFDFYSANIFSRPVEPKTWRNECYECFCIQKYTSFCSHWNYSLRFFLAFCVSELELIFFLPCPIVIIVITITVLCAKLRSIYIRPGGRVCIVYGNVKAYFPTEINILNLADFYVCYNRALTRSLALTRPFHRHVADFLLFHVRIHGLLL